MKKLFIALCLILLSSGLFAEEELTVLYEKRYQNCTIQLFEKDNIFTIIAFDFKDLDVVSEYLISSYDEELIKNFLFDLIDKNPKKFDFNTITNYEKENDDLIFLGNTTQVKSKEKLIKKHHYQLGKE